MTHVIENLVEQTSTSIGATTLSLTGAARAPNRGFADVMSAGDTTEVMVVNNDRRTEWQAAVYRYSAGLLTFVRLIESPTGSAISFSPGLKRVSMAPLAERGKWVRRTGAFDAIPSDRCDVDTSDASATATLPEDPAEGDRFEFNDFAGTWADNNFLVDPNGSEFEDMGNGEVPADPHIFNSPASVLILFSGGKYRVRTTSTQSSFSDLMRDFHAKGDGIADDTAAIQRAATAGGVIKVPEGTFRFGSVVCTKSVRFVGVGNKKSIFATTETENVEDSKMLDLQTNDVLLEGIHFELGGDGEGGTGVYDQELVGWPYYGVFANGRSGISVRDCTSNKGHNVFFFKECTDGFLGGVDSQRALRWHFYWEGGARWRVIGNQSRWTNYDGFKLGAAIVGGATPAAVPKDFLFTGNLAADCGRDGLDMAVDGCDNINIAVNQFVRFAAYGVECKKSGINGSTEPMRNLSVSSNVFEHTATSTYAIVFRVETGSAGAYEGVQANSNKVRGVDRAVNNGIWLGGASKGSAVGNEISTVTGGVILTQASDVLVAANDILDSIDPIWMFSGNPGSNNRILANNLQAVSGPGIRLQTGVDTVILGNVISVAAGEEPIYDETLGTGSQGLRTIRGVNVEIVGGVPTMRANTALAIGLPGGSTKSSLGPNALSFNRTGNTSFIDQLGIGGALRIRGSVTVGGDTSLVEFFTTLMRMYVALQIPDSLTAPATAVGYSSLYRSGTDLMLKRGDGSVAALQARATAAPASSSAAGIMGMIAYDASYLYVCTATNTWKRIALSGF